METQQPNQVSAYNILIKIGDKKLGGMTDNDMDIEAVVRESLSKYDQGVARKEVVNHTATFSVSGSITKHNETANTEFADSDDMLEYALKTNDDANFEFVYMRADMKAYQGKMIIKSYKESAGDDATAAATYSMSCEVVGSLTEVTGTDA